MILRSDRGPGWHSLPLAGLGLLVCLSTVGCRERQPEPEPVLETAAPDVLPAGVPRGYVEDRTCGTGGCHEELYRAFRQTDKGSSVYRPGPERPIEEFENSRFLHEASARYYEVIRRDDRFFFRRYQLDDRGGTINGYEREIDWVQGSGRRTRVFLYGTPAGEVFQFPIAWYADEPRWAMAPGFDRADHEGIQRRIQHECQFCHNAYPDLPAESSAYDAPHVFPAALPEGIGCQRCHGPGAEHTQLAMTGDANQDELRDSILDPGWLSTDRINDFCYQCHARRSHVSFVRFDRGAYSFLPGEVFSDYLVQVQATEQGDLDTGRIETYPHFMMEQSRCFVESEGSMSCITCHDSHHQVPESQQVAYWIVTCNRCHPRDASHLDHVSPDTLPPGVAPDDCVACHMPKRYTKTARLALSDHSIPRRPDYGEVIPKRDEENTVYVDFDVVDVDGEQRGLYRAAAAVEAGGGFEALTELERMIAITEPEGSAPTLILVRGLLRQKQWARAQEALATVLDRDPTNPVALEYRGVVQIGLGQGAEAIAVFEELLRLAPKRALKPTAPSSPPSCPRTGTAGDSDTSRMRSRGAAIVPPARNRACAGTHSTPAWRQQPQSGPMSSA